jgi:hypothetical protein
MNAARQYWECWEAMTGFRARVKASVERHSVIPQITPEEYLSQRRAELTRQLGQTTLIYLDTKHWVSLCDVLVKRTKDTPIYDNILGLLEALRQRNRICCPLSAGLFSELMKQSDPTTRQATARMMDFLSGGVCLHNWLAVAKAEFGRHICRALRIRNLEEAAFPVWTKVGFWAGEQTFKFLDEAANDSAVMEKVHIDLRWDMTCEDYQSMPNWIRTPDSFAAAWMAESEQVKTRQAETMQTFPMLVRERRRQLLAALKDTLLPMLALCRGTLGSPDEHVAAVLGPIYEGRDPQALPSLEVVAGLDAALTLDTARKVQANDMEDYLHAAQALPYCDAFFCDNFMAQKLRYKPLEFGKVYQTEIGSRPEEIVVYLESLS